MIHPVTLSINLPTLWDSKMLGKKIARFLNRGDLILFSGERGSGKSMVARAIILDKTGCRHVSTSHRPSQFGSCYDKTLHQRDECPSCMRRKVQLLETYKHLDLKIGHADLGCGHQGRGISDGGNLPDSFISAVEGILKDGVVLIEWPEKMRDILPAATLEITMNIMEDSSHSATLVNRSGWEKRIQAFSKNPL